jgi:solute carrier family 35 (UDP-sugar transporter), member A1/2/3
MEFRGLSILQGWARESHLETHDLHVVDPKVCACIGAACPQGYLWGILSALLSALAAVYTEWVMKRNNDSLYWQNIQLYAFGVLFNGLGLTVSDFRRGFSNGLWMYSLLRGYNWVTVLLVCNLAFSGLLVSWVMKFADSILKVWGLHSKPTARLPELGHS